MTPLQFFLEFGFYIGVAGQTAVVALWLKYVRGKDPDENKSLDSKLREFKKWKKL